MSAAKENILNKIREGLEIKRFPMPFPEAETATSPVFADSGLSIEETFAAEFIKLGGKFVFCQNELELMDSLHEVADLNGWLEVFCSEPSWLKLFHNNKLDFITPLDTGNGSVDACITACEYLVARTGSMILSSKQPFGRIAPVYYPVHIVIAYTQQIMADIEDGLAAIQQRYGDNLPSLINLNTGPSRTADIEKTLVVGVHGPKEVYCFLVNG